MCPADSKVILNYDNVPDLENRYKGAVIQPYEPGASRAKYFMADTVHMTRRHGMSWEQMYTLAKQAAPLAVHLVVDGMPADISKEENTGAVPVSMFTSHPVYAC